MRYFEMMAAGMTTMVGVFLTMLLLAVSAPAFLAIKFHARSLVARGVDGDSETAINELLAQHGFGFGVWSRVANVIAVLGPALAGVVGPPVAGVLTRLLEAAG